MNMAYLISVAGNEEEISNDTNHLTFAINEQGASLQIYSLNGGESLGPDTVPPEPIPVSIALTMHTPLCMVC